MVPVLRAGGRLAANNRPAAQLPFPGDAVGKRASRDAFALFSDVVVGAQALIVLGGPRRGRRGPVVARGRLDDPRVRRLAMQSGAAALLPARAGGDLLAAAGAAQVVAVELSAAGASADAAAAEPLVRSSRALLVALGVLGANDAAGHRRRSEDAAGVPSLAFLRARCACARPPTDSSRPRPRPGARFAPGRSSGASNRCSLGRPPLWSPRSEAS